MIESLMAQHSEEPVDVAIRLWEMLVSKIISVVGEGGFNSLYERSLFVARSTFPWLASGSLSQRPDHQFTGLKTSLAERTPEEAAEAASLLLITFTDILASLIGEQLTTSILCSAWGTIAPDTAGKGSINE